MKLLWHGVSHTDAPEAAGQRGKLLSVVNGFHSSEQTLSFMCRRGWGIMDYSLNCAAQAVLLFECRGNQARPSFELCWEEENGIMADVMSVAFSGHLWGHFQGKAGNEV